VSVTTFTALSLDDAFAAEEERDGRIFARVRAELGVDSFGLNATRGLTAGTQIVGEHDELGPGSDRHEELYFVASGHAEFTVDGETVDAPAGTFVFVRDPGAKRGAVAKEDGTTLVMAGGRPGQAWRITPSEAMREFFPLYNAKDYEGALAVAQEVLEDYPGNALAIYNIACMESLLGKADAALEHLAEALEGAPRLKENAKADDDFAPIRDDARFHKLIAD
jgi:tetratricopeptide (TPR) repeat protein